MSALQLISSPDPIYDEIWRDITMPRGISGASCACLRAFVTSVATYGGHLLGLAISEHGKMLAIGSARMLVGLMFEEKSPQDLFEVISMPWYDEYTQDKINGKSAIPAMAEKIKRLSNLPGTYRPFESVMVRPLIAPFMDDQNMRGITTQNFSDPKLMLPKLLFAQSHESFGSLAQEA